MSRRLTIVLAVLAAALAAHGAAWAWVVREVERGYAAWRDAARAEGWTVTAGSPEWGGYPFAARLGLPGPRLSGGEAWVPGGVAWAAERVVLDVPLARPDVLHVRPVGPQSVRLAGGPPIPVGAERFELRVPLDGQGLVDLRADGLRAGLPWGELGVEQVLARLAPLALVLDASGVALPGGPLPRDDGGGHEEGRPAFGPVLERVRFSAALTVPFPPGPTPARRAAAWRAAGGEVRVDGLEARWGRLNAAGSAAGGLDEALQPRGEARLRLTHYAAALDALAASGLLAPGAVVAARAVLGLMARPGPGGPEVEVPLRLEGGMLAMGRIPLLRLPALTWPEE